MVRDEQRQRIGTAAPSRRRRSACCAPTAPSSSWWCHPPARSSPARTTPCSATPSIGSGPTSASTSTPTTFPGCSRCSSGRGPPSATATASACGPATPTARGGCSTWRCSPPPTAARSWATASCASATSPTRCRGRTRSPGERARAVPLAGRVPPARHPVGRRPRLGRVLQRGGAADLQPVGRPAHGPRLGAAGRPRRPARGVGAPCARWCAAACPSRSCSASRPGCSCGGRWPSSCPSAAPTRSRAGSPPSTT